MHDRGGLLQNLTGRELGCTDRQWASQLTYDRCCKLELSGTRFFKTSHTGGVTWFDLDKVEQRFLLAGAADVTVAVYDTQSASETGGVRVIAPSFFLNRTSPGAHKFFISSVAWYPVDSGLFVTGSYDAKVKIWDTNTLDVVGQFDLPAKITQVAMSTLASSHCLVAASCQEQNVRLCDPSTGSFVHVLTGHKEAVWTVAWSNRSEFQLMSGDACGQIRLWDIRRSGCIAVLDQYDTQRSVPKATAASIPTHQEPAQKVKKAKGVQQSHAEKGPNLSTDMRNSLAKAHTGAVTCLLPSPDGLHFLSAGNDSRLRLWDSVHYQNRLVNYADAHNRAIRPRQLGITDDGSVVFYPTGSVIQAYDILSGKGLVQLQLGHFESINCCIYNANAEELYSGGNDCKIAVWQVKGSDSESSEANDKWED